MYEVIQKLKCFFSLSGVDIINSPAQSDWPTPAEARDKASPEALSHQPRNETEAPNPVSKPTEDHSSEVPNKTTSKYNEWLLKGKK